MEIFKTEVSGTGIWIRTPDFFLKSGSGSGQEKIMDPDPVNIRPDPKPWCWL